MSIGRLCSRVVHTATPDETVLAAAERMRQHNVGTLVVIDPAKAPVGVLTDRDLVVRVLAEHRAAANVRVEEVMSHHPRTLGEHTAVDDALAKMGEIGVRRAPVVGDRGQLIGIFSIDDMIRLLARELGNVGRVVEQSMGGATTPVPQPRGRRTSGQGIERAAGDPEC